MESKGTHSVVAIAGPTAVGKSRVAIALAEWMNCPVVSADSRQIYREMSIGTAKPSPEELAKVPHFLIDHISITQDYSTGKYEKEFLDLSGSIFKDYNTFLLCGGTGLFIKAALEGLDHFPKVPRDIRDKWSSVHATEGLARLQQAVREIDPVYAGMVDMQNPMRLMRALAVSEVAGKPYSSFLKKHQNTRGFKSIRILLDLPRKELYNRIDARVDAMMDQGLLEEVKSLLPYRGKQALQTVGYRELFAYFDGKCTLEEAIDKIKQHSRNYAKRQMTWFRGQGNFTPFHPEDQENIKAFITRNR